MTAYTPGPWKYTPHHYPHARGHIYMERARGACTIELTGAASMSQAELDAHGALIAAAPAMADLLRRIDAAWRAEDDVALRVAIDDSDSILATIEGK